MTFFDIPGTKFTDYFKDDGSGIAPAYGAPAGPEDHASYRQTFADGGPTYSRRRKTIKAFGGGHAAGSSNIVGACDISLDLPVWRVEALPTPRNVRAADYAAYDTVLKRVGYHSDKKPISCHAYQNLQYIDSVDELVLVGMFADLLGGRAMKVAGLPHGKGIWREPGYWPDIPSERNNAPFMGICFPTVERDGVFYNRGGGPLRRLDSATRQWTATGGNQVIDAYGAYADVDPSTGLALVLNVRHPKTSSQYRAWFIDTKTGAYKQLNVTGLAYPSIKAHSVQWVEPLGGWVALHAEVYLTVTWRLLLYKRIASDAAEVSELAVLNAPTRKCSRQNMWYEPAYRTLIFLGHQQGEAPLLGVRI